MITRPMLACKVTDLSQIVLPCYATPKIDGIRCLKLDGRALTRSFKDIPNVFTRMCMAQLPDGVDGELVTFTNGSRDDFHTIQSKIMSQDGEPELQYMVFDFALHETAHLPFIHRWYQLHDYLPTYPQFTTILPTTALCDFSQLETYEETCLKDGYEGVCTRAPHGFYKSGRSTLNQQFLLKIKRFAEAEAEVIGFVELQHNFNPSFTSELGLTKRSKAQSDLCPGDTLGTLQVRDLRTGIEFEIGTGFTALQRTEIWQNRSNYLNRLVTYKYQPYGMKDKPRIPVFKGFRYDLDICV